MPRTLYIEGLHTGAPQRVFIATPVMEAPVPEYVFGLLGSQVALEAAKIDYEIHMLVGDCHVDDARNYLVRNFLETDCTDLMFIDGDVGWNAVDLVRQLSFDVDIVAGIYPRKTDDSNQGYPVRPFDGPQMTRPDGLLPVQGVATGFLRIRRKVLEDMWEAEPRKHRAQSEGEDRRAIAIIFERLYRKEARLSGDYGFCQKVTDLGGKIYIDPAMSFVHVGTKSWSGSVGEFWCAREGLLTPRFCAAFERLRAGEASPDDYLTMFAEWGNAYSVPVEFLAMLTEAATGAGPILEIGSGLTTLVLAASGRPVHSVEHDLAWMPRVQAAISQLRLRNVTLHYSPLELKADGTAAYHSIPNVEPTLVFCDGPQQKWNRGHLFSSVSIPSNASFIADDASNETWLASIQAWAAERGQSVEVIGTEKRKFAVVAPKLEQLEAAE